jgi:exodeoxyribonuclease-1
MSSPTFYWHDYETFGIDPRLDRPVQFAGLRTDMEMQPVGDPLVIYCQPPDDYLPQPEACLVTGITPQLALERGVIEPEFAALIHEQMSRPGTCVVGYNSIHFDDEFTRNLLYRNFYDPYEREYRNGNSRWDLIDVLRLCHALRPEGMCWPEHETGRPSFRLEHLTAANDLDHGQAHDALSDVTATIALASKLRHCQPRLFDWALSLRDKNKARSLLDFGRHTPVVHVSSRYPAERGCLAVVAPLCPHPVNRNAVIVMDLASDPGVMAELDADEISKRVFTAQSQLPDGVSRLPLKLVHINRSPMLAPLNVLKGVDLDRIGLDLDGCLGRAETIAEMPGLGEKLRQVFAPPTYQERDVDEALYDGFLPDRDRAQFAGIRSSTPDNLAGFSDLLSDPRMPELLFRYRARNHADTLSADEAARWQHHRRRKLTDLEGDHNPVQTWLDHLAVLQAEKPEKDQPVLQALADYVRDLTRDL